MVTIPITAEALSLLNRDMDRVVEPGVFELRIGGSSQSLATTELIVRLHDKCRGPGSSITTRASCS